MTKKKHNDRIKSKEKIYNGKKIITRINSNFLKYIIT